MMIKKTLWGLLFASSFFLHDETKRNTFLDVIKLSGFCVLFSVKHTHITPSFYSEGSKINSLQTDFCVILQIFLSFF